MIIDYILEITRNVLGINKQFNKKEHREYANKMKQRLLDIDKEEIK